ncbi:MAG: 3'-5' exonuclease [Thermodesulfobacteriota bacterium]
MRGSAHPWNTLRRPAGAARYQKFKRLVTALTGTIPCHLSSGCVLTALEVLHVVSLDEVKGLEFDAAIVSDANKILHAPKTESAARTAKNRLYVAITRARKDLHIFCQRTIPPILWHLRRDIAISNTYVCKSCNSNNRVSESLGHHTDGLICGKCGEYQHPTFLTREA